MRIFKYLKKHWKVISLIVFLLTIQALGELSLPAYTSSIVDVGLTQSGIPDAVPTQIRETTLKKMSVYTTEEEYAAITSRYTDGKLNEITETERAELDNLMGVPMMLLAKNGVEADSSLDKVIFGMASKEYFVEQAVKARASAESQAAIRQVAVEAVREEYIAQGIDMRKFQMDYVLASGAKMLGITFLILCVAICASMLASYTTASISRELREKVYEKSLSFSTAELNRFSAASLITRNTNDIQQIQMVSFMMIRVVMYAAIIGIGGVAKVAGTRTGMGWIIGVAVMVIFAVVSVLFSVTMPKFKKMQKFVDRLNMVSREILTGLPVIRAFRREKYEEARFDKASSDLMQTQLFTTRVMSSMMPLVMLLWQGLAIAIVWFGARGADMGRLQVGNIVAFTSYAIQILTAFGMISAMSIMLPRANVSAERIDEVLETQPSIADPKWTSAEKITKGVVAFENVSFRFPDADEDIIHNISFMAYPGRTTAILGSTGSGKSALINLIPRLYDVTGGSITIDGVDIRNLSLESLRSVMGVVPQKGVLFRGDVESNIKFGNSEISDEDVKRAARIAQAEEFILDKDEQYQSPVSQGGTNVSGGQKQRLAIARAVAKKPKVFIFDDSFSALDYKTDAELRRALSENMKDATVIIVAQRISTVLKADQIIVIDEGRLVGKGTHFELIKSCPEYIEIAKSQLSEQELEMEVLV